jgi:hypothetical protein
MGDGDPGFDGELPRVERAAASGGKKRQREDDPGCSSKDACWSMAGSNSPGSISTARRQIGRVPFHVFCFLYLNLVQFWSVSRLNVGTFSAQIFVRYLNS